MLWVYNLEWKVTACNFQRMQNDWQQRMTLSKNWRRESTITLETNSNTVFYKGKKSLCQTILSLHDAPHPGEDLYFTPFPLGLHFSSTANTSHHHHLPIEHRETWAFLAKRSRWHPQSRDVPGSSPRGCRGSLKQAIATPVFKESISVFLSAAAAKAFQRNGH